MATPLSMIELRRMTPDELRRDLLNTRAEYKKTSMKVKMESEKNHSKVKVLRRNIARMEHALHESANAPSSASEKKTDKETSKKPSTSVKRSSPAKKA